MFSPLFKVNGKGTCKDGGEGVVLGRHERISSRHMEERVIIRSISYGSRLYQIGASLSITEIQDMLRSILIGHVTWVSFSTFSRVLC